MVPPLGDARVYISRAPRAGERNRCTSRRTPPRFSFPTFSVTHILRQLAVRCGTAGFFCLTALIPRMAVAQLSGRVIDESGRPVAAASVVIAELERGATTAADGRFRFGMIPPGRYSVVARRIGYAPLAKIVKVDGAPIDLTFTIAARPVRIEPVNVTASRAPAGDASSPLATSVLTGAEVNRDGGVSLAHAVERLPGVRNVSTGREIGKPMVRGMFGPRVLVLTDGSRLEDYSWSDEDGPSLDARIADRIEVIRGPASVLYGAEALAGAVNVVPASLTFSPDGSSQLGSAAEVYGASNNTELGTALMARGARGDHAWRVTGTGRFSSNYRTPDGVEPNSSFWSVNGEGALGIRRPHGSTTLRAAHYGGEFHLLEASGPEAGDTEGGPVRQTLDDRLQASNEYVARGIRFESKAQFQRHSLTEVSDDCAPLPGATTCTRVKDRPAFGLVLNTGTLDLLAHHGAGALTGTLGASGMYQRSASSGPIFLVPSATASSLAAFMFEQLRVGRVSLVAALRGERRALASDARPEIARVADNRRWSAVSGDVGVVIELVSHLSLRANYGTGWRAPTLFDLYANGANRAEARYEIGDPTLHAERSRTAEGGLRWASAGARAELSLFTSDVVNFIYTTPTAQRQDSLQVFRHVQGGARLTGVESALEARVTDALTLRGSHDFVRGTDRSRGVPLPLMPPPRTILGAEIALPPVRGARSVTVGGDVEIDQRQTRLNANDFATAGYTIANFAVAFEHPVRSRDTRFDVMVHNAFNTSYRDFLSRYKQFASAPGVNIIVKASVGSW